MSPGVSGAARPAAAAADPPAAPGAEVGATAALAGSRALAQAFTFAATVLLARAFGVQDYGRFVFAQALASVFIMVFDHGAQFQLVQQLPRDLSLAGTVLGRSWMARHLLSLLVPPTVGLVAAFDPHDTRRLAATAILLAGAVFDSDQLLAFAAFRSGGRLVRESLWTATGAALRLALTVAGVVLRLPFLPLLGILVAGKLVAAASSVWDARRGSWFPLLGSARGLVAHLRHAAPFTLFALAGVAYFQLGTILVSALGGHREAAVFQTGFMLFLGGMLLPDAVATAHYPALSRAFSADRACYRAGFAALVTRLSLLGIGAGSLLALAGPWVIRLLFPATFADAALVARGLGGALFLRCLTYAYGTGLHAGDGERTRARNNVAALALLLILGPLAVKRWGALGMVGALTASELGLLVLEFAATRSLRRVVA